MRTPSLVNHVTTPQPGSVHWLQRLGQALYIQALTSVFVEFGFTSCPPGVGWVGGVGLAGLLHCRTCLLQAFLLKSQWKLLLRSFSAA